MSWHILTNMHRDLPFFLFSIQRIRQPFDVGIFDSQLLHGRTKHTLTHTHIHTTHMRAAHITHAHTQHTHARTHAHPHTSAPTHEHQTRNTRKHIKYRHVLAHTLRHTDTKTYTHAAHRHTDTRAYTHTHTSYASVALPSVPRPCACAWPGQGHGLWWASSHRTHRLDFCFQFFAARTELLILQFYALELRLRIHGLTLGPLACFCNPTLRELRLADTQAGNEKPEARARERPGG